MAKAMALNMRVHAPSGAPADELDCRRTRPGDSVRYQPYSRACRFDDGAGVAGVGGGVVGDWWKPMPSQAGKKLAGVGDVPFFLEPGPAKWGKSVIDKLAASGSSSVDLSLRFHLRSDQKIATGTFGQVFEGKELETMKDVAIKVVRKEEGATLDAIDEAAKLNLISGQNHRLDPDPCTLLFPTCYATGLMHGHFCIIQ
ncbi:hypothetical protein T484DRAFT_1848298, partial [Baffinella frigidus]